jgi:putative Holliday junction resolvase
MPATHKLASTASEQSSATPAEDAQAPLRYMALDVGDRRIGVAISDALGLTAQPVLTLTRSNRRNDLRSLARLARRYSCSALVVGNPLYMSGDLSPQASKAQAFARQVRDETSLPVYLWDERLTTTEAHRHLHAAGVPGSDHRAVIDQVAAVLILQAFLDAGGATARTPFLAAHVEDLEPTS